MIIQGSNRNIIVRLPKSAESMVDISVALVKNGKTILQWGKVDGNLDMIIDGHKLYCLITQTDTMELPLGHCEIKTKWTTSNGDVEFGEVMYETVVPWEDTTLLQEKSKQYTDS